MQWLFPFYSVSFLPPVSRSVELGSLGMGLCQASNVCKALQRTSGEGWAVLVVPGCVPAPLRSHFSSDLWSYLLLLSLLGIELRMSGLCGKCFLYSLSCLVGLTANCLSILCFCPCFSPTNLVKRGTLAQERDFFWVWSLSEGTHPVCGFKCIKF